MKKTARGSCSATMAKPGPVGAAMPPTTVARPASWLALRVVTTDKACPRVLTEIKTCLLRSPSKVRSYHGKEVGRDKME